MARTLPDARRGGEDGAVDAGGMRERGAGEEAEGLRQAAAAAPAAGGAGVTGTYVFLVVSGVRYWRVVAGLVGGLR